MCSCQMQWSIISHISDIDASTSADEHLDNLDVTFLTGPVEWTEAMVITERKWKLSLDTVCKTDNRIKILKHKIY